MFKLRVGYFITGISTGLVLLFTFLWTLPDGKLYLVFCDVGQGDSAYIKFPDGRDMLVDGGPNDKVLGCLGTHMPFWDRKIDMVLMTHPQKDHMQGLISVFERYTVDYFVRSDVDNGTEGYGKLMEIVKRKGIPIRYITAREQIRIDVVNLNFLWPSEEQIAKGKVMMATQATRAMQARGGIKEGQNSNVLGVTIGDLNDYSLVFHLRYGTFDVLFTGDADAGVEANYTGTLLAEDPIELLKVPHHGSKTGMTDEFIEWVKPALAVISVGKNSYGHPNQIALDKLATIGAKVLRTDQEGDIEIESDGKRWRIN